MMTIIVIIITTFLIQLYFSVSPDGCVGKATRLVCGSNPGKGIFFLSARKRPNRPWDPPPPQRLNQLYECSFAGGEAADI